MKELNKVLNNMDNTDSMDTPIMDEEKCTASGAHVLCYRVQCNIWKKCYVQEQERIKQEAEKS